MPRPPNFTVSKDGARWRVNIPAAYSDTGKRQRLWFSTEQLAKAEQSRRALSAKRFGQMVTPLPPGEVADAKRAKEILSQFGDVTLTQAAICYRDAHNRRSKSVRFPVLMADFRKAMETALRSPRYLEGIRQAETRFTPVLGSKFVCDLAGEDIRAAFEALKLTPSRQAAFRRILSSAFGYGIKKGWLDSNPASATAVHVDEAGPREIEILSVAEARSLVKHSADLLPYVVFGLFCGIRPDELHRITWQEVKWDKRHVEVTRIASKTKRRRFVDLPGNAVDLLDSYRNHIGPIVPFSKSTWRRRFDQVRENAKITRWQSDILRHSYASYHIAHHNSLDRLARNMGHSSTRTAHDFYLDAVDEADAAEFWSIGLTKKPISQSSKVAK